MMDLEDIIQLHELVDFSIHGRFPLIVAICHIKSDSFSYGRWNNKTEGRYRRLRSGLGDVSVEEGYLVKVAL